MRQQPNTLTAPLSAARLVIMRDLLLAFRRPEQLLHPLTFFVLGDNPVSAVGLFH
ncbi:MAG: hypothetical protein WDM77_21885 [Steroidobacteraceae bacterium]